MLVFQGCLAAGSAAWGAAAARLGEPPALLAATAALIVGLAAILRWPLAVARSQDAHPSSAPPEPAVELEVAPEEVPAEEGPVLVTVDYDVEPAQAPHFVRAMHALGLVRRRNGSIRWDLFRDPANPRRFVETFVAESWAEYLRQRERCTAADRAVEDRARAFHRGDGAPPAVSHLIHAPDEELDPDEGAEIAVPAAA